MGNGYWWVEGILGVLLIIAPFFEHLRRPAAWTDVIFGILFVIWALVGYYSLGGRTPAEVRRAA